MIYPTITSMAIISNVQLFPAEDSSTEFGKWFLCECHLCHITCQSLLSLVQWKQKLHSLHNCAQRTALLLDAHTWHMCLENIINNLQKHSLNLNKTSFFQNTTVGMLMQFCIWILHGDQQIKSTPWIVLCHIRPSNLISIWALIESCPFWSQSEQDFRNNNPLAMSTSFVTQSCCQLITHVD